MSAHTPEREHYTSIAPREDDHQAAMCGCTLERDKEGIVRLYQCPTHEAAPEMLALLQRLTSTHETAKRAVIALEARALLARLEG